MIFHKECVICGKPFETKFPRQTICGAECKAELIKRLAKRNRDKHKKPEGKTYKKVCPNCGKEFETVESRRKYCSGRCVNAAHYKARQNKKRGVSVEKTVPAEKPKRQMTPALEKFFTKMGLMMNGERNVFPESLSLFD